jgi:DNA polymerase-3 subunit gamma/tau
MPSCSPGGRLTDAPDLMSYLVLARKWRPRRFAELVGQGHVVRALTNALDAGKVHHAFLFTGTRGVGKTTIARIFAKSLNCETGVGAEPCGTCAVCQAVDAGRFVDLIEIDAASNTGVDDVRDLIDNAQYMPSRGRYKVYLIDEVHMLSRNAFNALLKTLEEPPEHVKFLLATTDPQKLPVTVLSRCLQFNLKRLTPEQIGGQIASILVAEGIPSESPAVELLAHAADGSLRDGLSLLDQAIAYGAGALREAEVMSMLGSVDKASVDRLVDALVAGEGGALMDEVERLAGFGPDFGSLLEAIAAALHRIQLAQLVPSMEAVEPAASLASRVAPELVQLWYQMALSGRRDLPYAPSPRIGFEMALLRMLAFRPAGEGMAAVPVEAARGPAAGRAPALPDSLRSVSTAAPALNRVGESSPVPTSAPAAIGLPSGPRVGEAPRAAIDTPYADAAPSPPRVADAGHAAPPARARLTSGEDWIELVAGLGLKGPVRELAAHAGLVSHAAGVLQLSLAESLDYLRTGAGPAQLCSALEAVLGAPLRLEFRLDAAGSDSLHARSRRDQAARQQDAEQSFAADPTVQRLLNDYGGRIVPGSIRPLDAP